MNWYYYSILSMLELIVTFFLWGELENRVKKNFKIILVVMVLTVSSNEFFNAYGLDVIASVLHFVLILVLVVCWIRVPLQLAMVQFLLVFCIIVLLQVGASYLLKPFQGQVEYNFINGIIVNLLVLIVSFFIIKMKILKKVYNLCRKYNRIIFSGLINILIGSLVCLGIWKIKHKLLWNCFISIFIIVIFSTIINTYFIYQRVKINQQKRIIETHNKYMNYIRSLVDEVRQKQHDFNNHFNVLYGLIEIENTEDAIDEIKKYLQSIVDRVLTIDRILNIKDSILAAVIYSKKNMAEQNDIVFNIKIIGSVPSYPIEKFELVEILGNLLDNAIEATEKNKFLKKEVSLIIGEENNKKFIRIENTTENIIDINKMFEKGYSTKKEGNHGYGLYNVKKIINYYNARLEISVVDNNLLTFNIIFNTC